MDKGEYKIIVVGGGHAGCEAALAAARLGVETLLVTLDRSRIGRLPCNPSVGGIAKSHMVYELDALGGELGRNADYTGIQYRMLNTRKGPAVQSTRLQCDKDFFPLRMQTVLDGEQSLGILEDMVVAIRSANGKVEGVTCRRAGDVDADAVVVCTGTFLCGRVLIGKQGVRQGRHGEESAEGLSRCLKKLGFELGRFKTGTPPRIHRDSIDYAKMEIQHGDNPPPFFSRLARTEWEMAMGSEDPGNKERIQRLFHVEQRSLHPWLPGSDQVPCYLTCTNETTHQIVADNLEKSSLYGGMVQGTGVRYCPSIEDKIVKFPDRPSHHVFVEPEGRNSMRIYPNGTSNSLPEDVQTAMIRSIKGMERAEIIRPGYAIEYDYADPTQLFRTMETKKIENLYFAGQLNGTTGYEEAAGQGFIAGVNAALKVMNLEPLTIGRDEGYIGVMIDDLTTKGTEEPYRMFTSRSEYRLSLRQDNACYRLLGKAKQLGIADRNAIEAISEQMGGIAAEMGRLEKTFHGGVSLAQLLRRPGVQYCNLPDSRIGIDPLVAKQVEIEIKYGGYIAREKQKIASERNREAQAIPPDMEYDRIASLRFEAREKLKQNRPETLGQAARIPGVNPSDVSIIGLWLKRL